jgi:hypothetical protein
VLLGKQFCRHHDGRLRSRSGSDQRGDGCHNRFSRADVALQESVHGPRCSEIFEDLADGAALRPGQRKTQLLTETRKQIWIDRERLGVLDIAILTDL